MVSLHPRRPPLRACHGVVTVLAQRGVARTEDLLRCETLADMISTAAIVVAVLVLLPVVLVCGLFVWAALKDGQDDKGLQKRLGIRRRTRLGR